MEKKRGIREILADNLRARMAAHGWGQTDLAEKSGVSDAHISRLMNLQASATIDLVDQLARACRCQAFELLIDDDAVREAAIRRILEN